MAAARLMGAMMLRVVGERGDLHCSRLLLVTCKEPIDAALCMNPLTDRASS